MEKRKARRNAARGSRGETENNGANEDQAAYGYAHRAHCPDPKANYSFNPEATRVLPTSKRLRWKVTG